MTAYIIRRILYSIPILIGVNFIVFALFFFVNTPDDMARLHLGMKRVSKEQIDRWKREHSLDLPYFYNSGWKRLGSLSAKRKLNQKRFSNLIPGSYRLYVESPENIKLIGKRKIKFICSDWQACILPDEFKSNRVPSHRVLSHRELSLAEKIEPFRFQFEILDTRENLKIGLADDFALDILFETSKPGLSHRLLLEYKTTLPILSRFTETIFFRRSLKMLFFQYGKSDNGKSISSEIKKRIIPSMSITVPAFGIGLVLNIFFAMMLAYFRGTYVDYWGVFLCVLGMSISILFYIIGSQVLFGKILRLFPISGYSFSLDSIKFIIMPICIAVIAGAGGTVRFYRTIFLEEISKDYIRTARAKGLSTSTVLFVHALKNAMIPILTGVIVVLPLLFTGSLLLESFFSIPGMGSYMIDSIAQQDFAVVQATVSLGSFFYVVGLLLTDISYTIIDPRVRLE